LTLVDESTPAPRNRLLAALPPDELARLWPQLERVELPASKTLYVANDPIQVVFFPEAGWISTTSVFENGDSVDVGLVGREGMLGLPVILGEDRAGFDLMVPYPATALRMNAAAFRQELDRLPSFHTILLRYAWARHFQMAQTVACNGRHNVEQRLARWLLKAHDRADGDTFPMTHEVLSLMLGVRRAGVTVAAGVLQKAGLIRYSPGRVTISDRVGLEAASCECYGAVQGVFKRLFDPDRRPEVADHR
jgi:CRP-like cAMP-binding protein